MIEKIYKKAIYALARVAVKYIELRKKREQKKIKQNKEIKNRMTVRGITLMLFIIASYVVFIADSGVEG